MRVSQSVKGWCWWVGGAPLGVRRTLRGAPSTQAAAAAAVAVAAAAPADVFLKKNKKIGNAQRAKGGTKNNLDGWSCSCNFVERGLSFNGPTVIRGQDAC